MVKHLERTRTLSRRMKMMTSIAMAGVILFAIWYVWLGLSKPAWIADYAIKQFLPSGNVVPSARTTFLLVSIVVFQSMVVLYALQAMRKAFGIIGSYDAISADAAKWVCQSGVGFLLTAITILLSKPLMSLVLSLDMPVGHRFVAVTVGTSELLAALVSGTLIVFSHLIAVTAEIDDENRQIV